MLDNLRPPPTEELIHAWKAFFEGKLSSRTPINGTQAMQCRRLLDYLLQQPEETSKSPPKLEIKDLNNAFNALRTLRPRERTQHHLDLTRLIYTTLSSHGLSGKKKISEAQLWARYIKTLALYGGSKEATELLYAKWEDVFELAKKGNNLVVPVAEGLARDGYEQQLVELARRSDSEGVPFDKDIQQTLVTFFAREQRILEVKQWFERKPASGKRTAEVYPVVAAFAARNDLQEWAVPFFLELGDSKPDKPYWDSLLQAILVMGKGLKQVEGMMAHMTDSKGHVEADTGTINGLLRAAIETSDPSLAEDILSLATENGLKLDGETYLILMKLRLDAGYLPGVQTAFKRVIHFEPWHTNPDRWWEFGQLLNRYFVALCSQSTPDFKLISELVEQAEEERAYLEPTTVATLCIKFLENEQQFETMDILSVHAFQFSAAERDVIQDAFVTFCLDSETSTSRAWTGYQLLRQFFQDLSFDRRVTLMNAFFERKRPDMAAYVFGHMRSHRNSDYHPTHETYVACFEGFGQNPDVESLEMVYNMLKMDTTVQPDTRLYTALMVAHTCSGKAARAFEFWSEITTSDEGPSYASLEAAFWTLEHSPGGFKMAQKLWKKIEKMDVDVPPRLYGAYVGAIAASGEQSLVQHAVLRMETAVGYAPDAMT